MGTAYEDVYRDDKILGMTTGFEFCYLLFHIMLHLHLNCCLLFARSRHHRHHVESVLNNGSTTPISDLTGYLLVE